MYDERMIIFICDARRSKAVPAGKRKNNIWGTFIQEEELNTDLLGVGVGRYVPVPSTHNRKTNVGDP
jgi:hypothetical protein